jgi:hypothetical protein
MRIADSARIALAGVGDAPLDRATLCGVVAVNVVIDPVASRWIPQPLRIGTRCPY